MQAYCRFFFSLFPQALSLSPVCVRILSLQQIQTGAESNDFNVHRVRPVVFGNVTGNIQHGLLFLRVGAARVTRLRASTRQRLMTRIARLLFTDTETGKNLAEQIIAAEFTGYFR